MKTFHRAFYAFMRALITPYFLTVGRYTRQKYTPKSETYLCLTNHNTNYDFFLTGLCLKQHMYFVCSEHIVRHGFAGKLVKFLADPIPRKKGASSASAISEIERRLGEGDNVCMMVEGNRSFSGETGWISPTIVKVLRESGCGLINWVVHGGYFVNPRWSLKQRRGPMWGEVVREYTPDELAAMSDEEIVEAIRRDMYVNAYADQDKDPKRYRSKRPAEDLETALFACPCCGSFSGMKSERDRFFCTDCGMELKFDEYGYFSRPDGSPAPFRTILDWSHWQTEHLKEFVQSPDLSSGPIFSDEHIRLSSVTPGQGTGFIAEGRLSLYPDRLLLEAADRSYEYPLEKISKFSIVLRSTILFTCGDEYLEMKSDTAYSALKYLIAYRFLKGKEYI